MLEWKLTSGSPPIYCFVFYYCCNVRAHFDKLYPWTLKNLFNKDKKWQIQDSKTRWQKKFVTARCKNHPEMGFDTHKKCLQYFEIGPEFYKTHVIQGTILYPCKSSICAFASSYSCTTCVFRKSKRDRDSQLWSCMPIHQQELVG